MDSCCVRHVIEYGFKSSASVSFELRFTFMIMILAMQLAKLDDCRRPQYYSSCAGSLAMCAIVVTRHDGASSEHPFHAIMSRHAHVLITLSS
jgi:hypothetical protein